MAMVTASALFSAVAPGAHAQTYQSTPASNTEIEYYAPAFDPYGGYLRGAAAVIRAQGRLMKDQQEAFLTKEQVKSAKLDNRRKEIEQWLWERETLPTLEDERQRFLKEQLLHHRNDPPITEIWSGKALNHLLLDAMKMHSEKIPADSGTLNEEMLAKVSVTSGKNGGNIGLLKKGELFWPLLLRRKEFETEHKDLDRLVLRAVEQAKKAQVDVEVMDQLTAQVDRFRRALASKAKTCTAAQYTETLTFINDLNDALKVLQQRDAGDYLNGKYAAKGKTVADLVRHMKENGLLFAPAATGCETAYVALYQALRDYDAQHGSTLRTLR
jgi:hypothetical protein